MAAATDLLSLADALQAVRLSASHTQHVSKLEGYVTAVSKAIDELVGPVVRRTVTGERHDGGCAEVWLRRAPVYSISAVKVWRSGTSDTLTAESLAASGGYLAELNPDDPSLLSGVLRRRSGWSSIMWEAGTVEVTYVAGRFADTAAVVGSRFHTAAVLTLKNVWQGETDSVAAINEYDQPVTTFPASIVPAAARALLGDQIQYRGVG